MEERYDMLRKKMERYSAWEDVGRRSLNLENRLKQFFALHDLLRLYGDDVLKKLHEDHLMALIKTRRRLNKISENREAILSSEVASDVKR
jgi:hypothetical protein